MAGQILVIFAGITTILLSATSALLSYSTLHRTSDQQYTTTIIFLGAFSVFMFFAALLYTMWAGLGKNTFLGMETRTGIPLMLLFGVICINAAIWQFKVNDDTF